MFGWRRGLRRVHAPLFWTQQLWLNEPISKCSPFAQVWAASTAAHSLATWPLSPRYSLGLNCKTHKNAAVAEPLPPRSDGGKSPELNSNGLYLPWQTSDLWVHFSNLGKPPIRTHTLFLEPCLICLVVLLCLCPNEDSQDKKHLIFFFFSFIQSFLQANNVWSEKFSIPLQCGQNNKGEILLSFLVKNIISFSEKCTGFWLKPSPLWLFGGFGFCRAQK